MVAVQMEDNNNNPVFYDDQAPAMPMGYGQQSDKADLLRQITPEKIVELLRKRLMGQMENEKGQWITNKYLQTNAISEMGAWELSNLMLSVSNSSTSISKLDDKTIRKRAYSLTETSVKMMITNWIEYEITNTAQLNYVAEIVYSISFIVMKQADAEGIRKMIMSIRTESHHSNDGDGEKKRGLFRR